jgi:hypothetical protein
MRSSSAREAAASKIAPQIGSPLHQILISPYLLVENERHAELQNVKIAGQMAELKFGPMYV